MSAAPGRVPRDPSLEAVALADVRLLGEARRGNPEAVRRLLEPHLSGIWSICRGYFADEQEAADAVFALRDAVASEARAFATDAPVGAQLYALLWRLLDPEPERAIGIREDVPPRLPDPDPAARVLRAVRGSAPRARLHYLFWLATGLPPARLAELTGDDEHEVRACRARVAMRIHEELSR